MIFFMVLFWFLFYVMGGSISPTSADLSKSGWPCHTPYTCYHRLGIVRVDSWNHNNCNSASQAFWHVFAVFSDCVSVSDTSFLTELLM